MLMNRIYRLVVTILESRCHLATVDWAAGSPSTDIWGKTAEALYHTRRRSAAALLDKNGCRQSCLIKTAKYALQAFPLEPVLKAERRWIRAACSAMERKLCTVLLGMHRMHVRLQPRRPHHLFPDTPVYHSKQKNDKRL